MVQRSPPCLALLVPCFHAARERGEEVRFSAEQTERGDRLVGQTHDLTLTCRKAEEIDEGGLFLPFKLIVATALVANLNVDLFITGYEKGQ